MTTRRLRLSTPAIALALVMAACSDADDGDALAADTTAAATTAPATTAPAPTTTVAETTVAPTTVAPTTAAPTEVGCGSGARTGVIQVDLTSGGLDRTYRRYVPASYDGSGPLPVVLNFHGLTSNAEQQAGLSNLEGLAGVEGFIAVHPQGSIDPNTGNTFFDFGLGGVRVDDVAYVADLLDDLERTLCVDTSRVYSMGMSNGGYMSSRLACDLSDRIAAIAPVAATIFPDDCDPSRPVPVLAMHGTADDVVPYDGGGSVLLDADAADGASDEDVAVVEALFEQRIPDEVGEWADHNGCGAATETEVTGEVTEIAYEGCAAPVTLYRVEEGGHTWPGSFLSAAIPVLGKTTLDIDATREAWAFFQQHTL